MPLGFILLFFLCRSAALAVEPFGTMGPTSSDSPQETTSFRTTVAEEEITSDLQVVATPDYPVAAGQTVHLHCSAFSSPDSLVWSWQRLENQNWTSAGGGRNLTLAEPQQSGMYRCYAEGWSYQRRFSTVHTVYIVSVHATVDDKLGIAAFFLSLLALIIHLAVLSVLGCQRLGFTLTSSNTVDEGVPGTAKSPKGGLPKAGGDVYMNYTSTNPAYSDLDPTSMGGDNVYASLS